MSENIRTWHTNQSVIPAQPGIQRHTVEIPVRDGEIVTDNNRRTFIVDVVPRQELMVLFLEGRPRPEFAYIKRALERDDGISQRGFGQSRVQGAPQGRA